MFDPSNLYYLLSPLVASLGALILIALVWRGAKVTTKYSLFYGILLSVGVYGLFTFAMRSSPDVEQALLWVKMMVVAGTATYVFFYHFTVAYTDAKRQTGFVVAAYFYFVAIILTVPSTLISPASGMLSSSSGRSYLNLA